MFFPPSKFFMKNFKRTEKLKEYNGEYPYIHHIESIINILPYLITYLFIQSSFWIGGGGEHISQ